MILNKTYNKNRAEIVELKPELVLSKDKKNYYLLKM